MRVTHRPDVLLLGRDEHVERLTGIRRVKVAGTRPWMPACVVGDAGVHLLPFTWDPARLAQAVLAAPGVADARVVGVDGMSPRYRALLAALLERVEVVDAAPYVSA
jgi:hypothetical protein